MIIKKTTIIALVPLLIFVMLFLGSGIFTGSFYTLPAPIAVLGGIVTAFLLFKNTINENVKNFISGCGNSDILTMCIIVLLAGAFAQLTKEIGATQTISLLAKNYLPSQFLYVGVFVLASFLSFSSGTSVGTITTLLPIVSGFIEIEELSHPLILASLLGGAMFGDNLSFISDTTVASTQSQGCSMKDKFRVNVKIALPASVLTIIILTIIGFYLHSSSQFFSPSEVTSVQWLQILPYFVVIVLASTGLNVFVTLFCGILLAGIIGFFQNMSVLDFSGHIYLGFQSMNEIFLVFLLMGGLTYMVEKQGGIQFLLNKMAHFMTSPLKAKTGIALLVGIVDAAIANNTIAIVVSAPVAKKVSHQFGIKPSYVASILDISSCVVQGIVPYGAQVLLLLANDSIATSVGYFDLISHSYYIWLLLVISVVFFVRKSKETSGFIK